MTRVLAFDFGASSGRAILASYEDGRLSWEEIHRFENIPVEQDGHLRWDFDTLLLEVQAGLDKAGAFDSVGFDTWGVDFGLLDEQGALLELPVHYRDARTQGILPAAFERMPAEELYHRTGNQIMPINTLFQLLVLQTQQPELWKRAKKLLFMPDLFAHALCGRAACERSIASTSQMLDPATGSWDGEVLATFGVPWGLFAPPVQSGSILGTYGGAKVIAVAGHDTQCAVAALPTNQPNVAFLSCGTWSLLGCELDAPLLTDATFSNELGAGGKVHYLKNIIGLWLIQESRREWKRQGKDYSYAELERLALTAEPFRSFIDPDDPTFASPGDIPERVRECCRRTGQPVPESVGAVMRCIYESLAFKYRYTLHQLSAATGKRFTALHVLGGGSKDGLLCRMTANACGLPVVAGPVEATALGNIIIQLTTLGALKDIAAGRELIARTETLRRDEPVEQALWNSAYHTYTNLWMEREDAR